MGGRLRLPEKLPGRVLAIPLDVAYVGLERPAWAATVVGAGGGGGVQAEADGLAARAGAGPGDDPGSAGIWPGLPGRGEAVRDAVAEIGEHQAGAAGQPPRWPALAGLTGRGGGAGPV